ncbi:hypothetical protein BBOV_III011320 [Babesia bovis T2Bo]|uniref:Uncharacterized protein n=1 Tax=Babesia bovis TaxID=5865 RepID=A7AQ50_BABBO|nr:hypothetical protein BBOV_III011320 [Babesia bovis T2Bo]EDO08684.1 hypothetical protein BBOV_III011320 [Babesia bovis T2Bo]|eukprot:XP_001612252.1 hypothetical protein [Babesia bovis T2Bo]
MVCVGWFGFAIKVASILLISTRSVASWILDLNESEFPEFVQVTHGTFSNGGIYRMIQSPARDVMFIKSHQVYLTGINRSPNNDAMVYVEEYKRDERTFVSVLFYKFANLLVERRYYEPQGCTVAFVSRFQVQSFVNGPINLCIDLEIGMHHPVIEPMINVEDGRQIIAGYIGNKVLDFPPGSLARVWSKDSYFRFMPIINIDPLSKSLHNPPSALIGFINGYYQDPDSKYLVINIEEIRDVEYRVWIPGIDNGTFKPQNILQNPPKISVHEPKPVDARAVEIIIDISRTSKHEPDVLAMINLSRGVWLYSQYTILPIRHVEDMNIIVENSAMKTEIYQVEDDYFITYVEIFEHMLSNNRFVVVNMRKLESPFMSDTRKVFKYNWDVNNPAYTEILGQELDACIAIITNIKSLEPIF